jgi:hypothetical protein
MQMCQKKKTEKAVRAPRDLLEMFFVSLSKLLLIIGAMSISMAML